MIHMMSVIELISSDEEGNCYKCQWQFRKESILHYILHISWWEIGLEAEGKAESPLHLFACPICETVSLDMLSAAV
jgi:hypothetical protein